MIRITRNLQFWRATSLVVLILALAGPWVYDLINVPAEYQCTPPNIRLYGDFCGMPLTGYRIVSLMFEAIVPFTVAFVSGTAAFAERIREYSLMLFIMLPLLPLVSTPLLLGKKNSRVFRMFNLVAWGIAGLVTSFWSLIIISAPYDQKWRLWGGWVYLVLVLIVLVLEISTFNPEKKSDNHPPKNEIRATPVDDGPASVS